VSKASPGHSDIMLVLRAGAAVMRYALSPKPSTKLRADLQDVR
jgi:hypothetical protein